MRNGWEVCCAIVLGFSFLLFQTGSSLASNVEKALRLYSSIRISPSMMCDEAAFSIQKIVWSPDSLRVAVGLRDKSGQQYRIYTILTTQVKKPVIAENFYGQEEDAAFNHELYRLAGSDELLLSSDRKEEKISEFRC